MYGYLPGSYRTVPTVVRNAYRPEQLAVSTPKSLAVLPSGAKSADPYRLTPQELFELGMSRFNKGDLKTAGEHLTELLKNWNLDRRTFTSRRCRCSWTSTWSLARRPTWSATSRSSRRNGRRRKSRSTRS